MPIINHAKKEINAKIIYFGPATGGKAANLQFVYSKLKESTRGIFKSMALQNDRMLFFDFMPSAQGNLNGYNIRFHVYTLTGTVLNPSSWEMVLKGVDGLVFVADSSPDGMSSNVESFRELQVFLAKYGKVLDKIPCVIQCNKQDLPRALAPEMIERELAPLDSQLFPAVAAKGEGVLESIFALIRMILREIRDAGIETGDHHAGFQSSSLPADDLVQETACIAVEAQDSQAGSFAAAPELVQSSAVISPVEDGLAGIDAIDAPMLEIAGDMEIIDGGRVQLPLSIKYGGKVKQVILNISLSTFVD
jgi:signal recognition particle receptor subunit beta